MTDPEIPMEPTESAASTEPAARRRSSAPLRALRAGWEWAKSIALAFLVFLFVKSFFVEAFKIPSGSMEGTLLVGDFLLVNKMLYGAEVPFLKAHLPKVREPRIGDVLVFQFPEDPTKHYVKRLVGVPGDTVEMRNGELFRNRIAQREVYAWRSHPGSDASSDEFRWQVKYLPNGTDTRRYHPSRNNWGPLVVPSRNFFVLGDNRDNSQDSRYWGFVPDTLVRGSPIFVYYSFSPDSASTIDWLTNVRWRRLGELIR